MAHKKEKPADKGIKTGTAISPEYMKTPHFISTKLTQSTIDAATLFPSLANLADPNTVTVGNEGLLLEWFYSPILGQPRNININNLRLLAQSTWPAINIQNITRRISNLEWAIVVKPEFKENLESDPRLKKKFDEICRFFEKPNNQNQSMNYLISAYTRSLMEVDGGVFVKVFNKASKMVELQARDGATFIVNVDMHGNYLDPAFYQYSFIRPSNNPIPFKMREVVYGMLNPQAGSPYGKAPTQYIEDVANILMDGIRYNKNFFERNQIPSTMFWTTAKLNEESKNRLKVFLEKEVPKNPNAMYLLDGLPDFNQIQLTLNQKDAEFLNSQAWFSKLVMAIFGTTPAVLGFTDDVNKATEAGQESVFFDATMLPVTQHISSKINREIMPEFFIDYFDVSYDEINFDMIPFEFKFFVRNRFTEEREREGDRKDIQLGVLTPNEYRRKWNIEDGKPVPGGDLPKQQAQGLSSLFSTSSLLGSEEKSKKKVNIKKKEDLAPIDPAPKDSIPEDKNVVSFQDDLDKIILELQTQVIRAVRKNRLGKRYKQRGRAIKNIDMFISSLQLLISEFTDKISVAVEVHIRELVKVKLTEVEAQLNINLPPEAYNAVILDLTDQLLNGYMLPNGKFYDGILALPPKVAENVTSTMAQGIQDGLGEKELINGLNPIFENTAHNTQAFVRTEINRASTKADLDAWQASGVVKGKEWITARDGRVRDNHAALDGVVVALGDTFKAVLSDGTMVEVNGPPFEINCRCTLAPVV